MRLIKLNHSFDKRIFQIDFSFTAGTIKTTNNDGPIKKQPEIDFVEQAVCSENDIAENQMKQFDLGESRVLLIKQKGVLSAIGTKCSHYGALLSTGALGDGRVRCPWHGACFNIRTGDIEDFPGQGRIEIFKCSVQRIIHL